MCLNCYKLYSVCTQFVLSVMYGRPSTPSLNSIIHNNKILELLLQNAPYWSNVYFVRSIAIFITKLVLLNVLNLHVL